MAPPRLLPHRLAWIGPGAPRRAAVAEQVVRFDDSDEFLLTPEALGFDFYVVHVAQQGVSGLDLVRLIRKRSDAGLLVLDDTRLPSHALALDSGADMVLPADVSADDLSAAVCAVHRRVGRARAVHAPLPWTLLEARSALQAPDGSEIALSDTDVVMLQCFAESADGKVERAALVERLWGTASGSMENALHAAVYRLRKRIEQAGHAVAPVHAVARIGYEFRARLVKA